MGWWSEDILGGDTPLDILCGIEDILPENIDLYGEINTNQPNKRIQEILTKNVNSILEYAKKWKDSGGIPFQVIAFIFIRYGVPITSEMKIDFIKACESDEWAKEDRSREKHIENLIETIKNYNGIPVHMNTKGLFQTISEI